MSKLSRLAIFFMMFPLGLALSGCLPSTGTPERLYPIALEMDGVRTTEAQLVAMYQGTVFSNPPQAKLIRNEIIADRMYAIDVYYVQYENALTRESQEVGFGTLATAGALSTASSVFTPPVTKTALSALSTVAIGVNGHYNSDILLAQTMRTIQKQMRASRNLIAANISAKQGMSVVDYPLSAALSDLEEYYNAGTLTSGVIDTSTTVGIQESNTKDLKQDVNMALPSQRAAIINGGDVPSGGGVPGGGGGSGGGQKQASRGGNQGGLSQQGAQLASDLFAACTSLPSNKTATQSGICKTLKKNPGLAGVAVAVLQDFISRNQSPMIIPNGTSLATVISGTAPPFETARAAILNDPRMAAN